MDKQFTPSDHQKVQTAILLGPSLYAKVPVAKAGDETRSAVINTLATLVDNSHDMLLEANARDLEKMSPENPLYDRLQLTHARLDDIADSLRQVALLPTPVGQIIEQRTLANGINLRKQRVPFGVIGVIYEARPNVTFDVFALCMKSANVSALKGGKDAENSNLAAMQLIHEALRQHGLPEAACTLLPSTHEATAFMLQAVGYIDVCIPRGSRRLIDFVRQNALVPVIETGAGVVHTYLHSDAPVKMASDIIFNAKTRRVSVCNALDTVLVNEALLPQLAEILQPLAQKNVVLHADAKALLALEKSYPASLLLPTVKGDPEREWMSYDMNVFTVPGPDEALKHIARYGSGHSESIVTQSAEVAHRFEDEVDAACVYWNLPTAFTDGGQFELGAEIGISTQKLGPRGPMGLAEMTTYRYMLEGHGQTRP